MLILKVHTLIALVIPFVREFVFWGDFSEESFEHFESVSLTTRRRHSQNKSLGA